MPVCSSGTMCWPTRWLQAVSGSTCFIAFHCNCLNKAPCAACCLLPVLGTTELTRHQEQLQPSAACLQRVTAAPAPAPVQLSSHRKCQPCSPRWCGQWSSCLVTGVWVMHPAWPLMPGRLCWNTPGPVCSHAVNAGCLHVACDPA